MHQNNDQLFQIFYKHFAGAKLYGLLDDLKNNQQTKEVEIYTDLINKRDIILKKMREYKNHKNNHKPKYSSIITYKNATGLEALIGYLYLNNNSDRINDIMNYIYKSGGK